MNMKNIAILSMIFSSLSFATPLWAQLEDAQVITDASAVPPSPAFPCGASGTIEQRIGNCHTTNTVEVGGQRFSWRLVNRTILLQPASYFDSWTDSTRSISVREIWQDVTSGSIWSDIFSSQMNQAQARQVCLHVPQAISAGVEGNNSVWHLPTASEYQVAYAHGASQVFLHASWYLEAFWTSSRSQALRGAWTFIEAGSGNLNEFWPDHSHEVRCSLSAVGLLESRF